MSTFIFDLDVLLLVFCFFFVWYMLVWKFFSPKPAFERLTGKSKPFCLVFGSTCSESNKVNWLNLASGLVECVHTNRLAFAHLIQVIATQNQTNSVGVLFKQPPIARSKELVIKWHIRVPATHLNRYCHFGVTGYIRVLKTIQVDEKSSSTDDVWRSLTHTP